MVPAAPARFSTTQFCPAAAGQNWVVENRAGAAGAIGARAAAKAPPDGYTLMVGHSGVFGVAPALYGANASYDPRKDFSPIGLIASFTQILVVHPSLPVHTVKDLIALAKEEPGKITYATAGIGSGSHISTELLNSMSCRVELQRASPIAGAAPHMPSLLGGGTSRWRSKPCLPSSARFAADRCALSLSPV